MPLLLTAILGNQWARLAIAVGLAFTIGLTGGIVKGMSISNADRWQKHAEALEIASKQKDALLLDDIGRAEADQAEIAKRDALIESLIHETSASSSRLTPDELKRLRSIANARG